MIKIGIIGAYRGSDFAKAAKDFTDAKVTAICERDEKRIEWLKQRDPENYTYFSDFDEMLNSDIDAVILCNYFCEHAPFAIKALKAGKHVLSETLSNITMAEGVALKRAADQSGKIYMIGENYPYMCALMEMKKEYEKGYYGKVLYADGEYNHPMCGEEFNELSPGIYHWRSWLPSTYYVTHSIGPLMYVTQTMPKTVNALSVFAPEQNKDKMRYAADATAAILCQMDNGALFRVTGWSTFYEHSIWYRLGCEKGGMETVRGDKESLHISSAKGVKTYKPTWDAFGDFAAKAAHGGGDFWTLYYFVQSILTNTQPFFNVDRAVTMSSVAILGWRSALEKGKQYDIPDFNNPEDCKKYENDTLNPFPDKNGHVSYPCCSKTDYVPPEEARIAAERIWKEKGFQL